MSDLNLRDFLTHFGTTAKCLDFIRRQRWPDGIPCKKCERVTGHHLIEGRKCYSCQECGSHVHPTAGTLFHKSRVPLPDWFFVIWQFSKTRAGFSAKQVEREIGVSYPTALRMCNLIRERLGETPTLSGVVEADETYIGGAPRYKGQNRRRSWEEKVAVVGVVQRGGSVRAWAVPFVRSLTVLPLIEGTVEEGATVYTDESGVYNRLSERGYTHSTVKHRKLQYVREEVDEETGEIRSVHTNSIEGFWSYPKSAILRIHRGVSRDKMQGYLDEHTFRYNHRNDDEGLFGAMVSRMTTPTPSLAA